MLVVVLGSTLIVGVWLIVRSGGDAPGGTTAPPSSPHESESSRRPFEAIGSGAPITDARDSPVDLRRFGNLSVEKIAVVRKIERDYDEIRWLEPSVNGTPDAAELERRRLLDDEMRRDIAAALSPGEIEEYYRRNSAGARRVAGAVRRFVDLTDTEFLALAQLQDQFETADRVRWETESSPDHTQIRTILPDDRFYAYLARIDPVYQLVNEFARGRTGLTSENTYELYQLQRAAWEVNRESKLDSPEGKRRLAELNVRLETLLGTEGAAAYRHSNFGRIFAYPAPIP